MRRGKSIIAVLLATFIFYPSVVFAENLSAKDYMAEGIRAAYDDMNLIYQAYYDEEGNLEVQPAGYVAIYQEWDEDWIVSRTYLDENCNPVNRVDGYAKAVWESNDSFKGSSVNFYDMDGHIRLTNGLNLAKDINVGKDGWSEWLKPQYDSEDYILNVGEYNLGYGTEGEPYTCHIEIEFKDVSASENEQFVFRTVGSVDNSFERWSILSIWNSSFIWLTDIPEDGTYTFTQTFSRTKEMSEAHICKIGFRCERWSGGMFRIRNLKIEKGSSPSAWTPGL